MAKKKGYNDDEKWLIPERFRASLDANDKEAHELLKRCDEEQKELGERINAPFLTNTPQERQRAKAYITIEALLTAQRFVPLVDDQIEQLAEAYATIGRYDVAAETTKTQREHYRAIWAAIFKPDGSWCEHPVQHAYLKERIFSLKHGKEKSLMACNLCGFLNVQSTPSAVKHLNSQSGSHQGKTKGLSIDDALAYHQQNVSPAKAK